mmetsp:Transcript_2033/g.4235  ORF Transcript_2033/g.4235 Transcript_2033/m.4235 type:complete len:201 (+) Transcript_2033:1014-1616(+)
MGGATPGFVDPFVLCFSCLPSFLAAVDFFVGYIDCDPSLTVGISAELFRKRPLRSKSGVFEIRFFLLVLAMSLFRRSIDTCLVWAWRRRICDVIGDPSRFFWKVGESNDEGVFGVVESSVLSISIDWEALRTSDSSVRRIFFEALSVEFFLCNAAACFSAMCSILNLSFASAKATLRCSAMILILAQFGQALIWFTTASR